jgi:hypothetical protein
VAREEATRGRDDRRQLLRRICLAVMTLAGAVWLGEVALALVTYCLIRSGSANLSLTWELGRWDRQGFTASGGHGTGAMTVMGIGWILLPLIAVAAGVLARRLKTSPPTP